MNTQEQLERMQHWLDSHPVSRLPRDPIGDLDEDTLRRMHQGGLSKHARREQRRPVPLRVDEYGYGNDGRWYAAMDGRRSA